ncbi:MAG: RNA repair transcriptional activator RtcR [Planctomycetia bacterium]|nr:RNA repair transcriptional activator RtcR [Planctomycetia bacterium]
MSGKKTIVYGILGSMLDFSPRNAKRWNKWRPTVGICQQEDFLIDQYHLFYGSKEKDLLVNITKDIAAVSPETEIVPHLLEIDDRWDFLEVFQTFHQFAVSRNFDPEKENYLINITTGTHVEQICLFLLTESRHFPARILQCSPSRKTEGTYQIIDLNLARYDQLAGRFAMEKLKSTDLLKSGIETKNRKFNEMIEMIEQIALRSRSPILLTGSTGVGKTMLAKKIFELKKMRKHIEGRLIIINCATLHGDQMKSAFFGHVKGAFTGADQNRTGLLRQADQGVLFLDEIGELGLDEQAALLHAIEEKKFYPVGSDKEIASDFQLIAGTNRNLNREVQLGKFRDDLLARINLWTFHLPGLSDRKEDIAPNIDYELRRFSEETGSILRFNSDALKLYLAFARSPEAVWSGNFRDLAASISRLGTLSNNYRISISDVKKEIERLRTGWQSGSISNDPGKDDLIEKYLGKEQTDQIDRFDRPQLEEVLRICLHSASLSEAGRILFDCSRKKRTSVNDADRLRKYLAKFNLSWEEIESEMSD